MKLVALFFLLLASACLLFLAIGLYKPWVILWWEDTQNRRKVIKVYGTCALICLIIFAGLRTWITVRG